MSKKTKKAIDVELIDLEKLKTLTSENPGTESYPIDKGGVSFSPTKEGAIKSRAFKVMDEQIGMQMENIIEQIQVLKNQVEALQERRLISEEIYRSKMSFEPIPGKDYYLYDSPQGKILSLLSPKEWGEKNLKKRSLSFLAQARLLADCTWQIKNEISE